MRLVVEYGHVLVVLQLISFVALDFFHQLHDAYWEGLFAVVVPAHVIVLDLLWA